MQILLDIVFLAIGFLLLAKGADFFVDGASSVARRFKIPQLVIGLTIVAMGTSMPEAAVSIQAALGGNADISIGNVVGSNILNVLIILGISSLVFPLLIQKSTQKYEIPIVIGASVLLLILGFTGRIAWWGGIILLLAFAGYLTYLFFQAKNNKDEEETVEIVDTKIYISLILALAGAVILVAGQFYEPINNIYALVSGLVLFVGFSAFTIYLYLRKRNPNREKEIELPIWKSLVFVAYGIAMIIFGSEFAVTSATSLALRAGLSESFIGLTIVALGTSLPELFTSVSAAMKKNSDIAIGNVVGSNIFNILFILGISSLIVPINFDPKFLIDTAISLGACVMLLVLTLRGRKLHRYGGAIMLLSYAGYFTYLLLSM